jgi:hypothetical protein
MKNIILLSAFAAIVLSSCKRDHTCTCTSTGGGSSATTSISIYDTKKHAKADCEVPPTTNAFGSTTTCKLDK